MVDFTVRRQRQRVDQNERRWNHVLGQTLLEKRTERRDETLAAFVHDRLIRVCRERRIRRRVERKARQEVPLGTIRPASADDTKVAAIAVGAFPAEPDVEGPFVAKLPECLWRNAIVG